jgi:hypothetical protein
MLVVYLRIKNITYMNKFTLLMIWCLVVGTLVSCSKDAADPAPAPTVEQDYMPTTAKSTWTYGGSSPYILTVTGATKVINGKTFYEMETKDGATTRKSYLLKDNGVYTGIGLVPISGSLEITILKDKAPVGESWEQISTINGVDTKIKLVIVEKDLSKTVEGKTYKNVIHVKMETTMSFMGEEIDLGLTSHFYFAKGVGLILSDLGDQAQAPLLTYDVK